MKVQAERSTVDPVKGRVHLAAVSRSGLNCAVSGSAIVGV